MFAVLKLGCLIIYALALASLAGLLPAGVGGTIQNVALVLLALHALELVLMFRHVRLYRGPLVVSVLLTLLFGLLHWKPLADAAAKATSTRGDPSA
jgi:hypothetical protein